MSFTTIAVATAGTLSTADDCKHLEVMLVHAPSIHEGTYELWAGPAQNAMFWTMRLDTLQRAFVTLGIPTEEGNVTVMATSQSVVITLPLYEGFAVLQFETAAAQDFVARATTAVLCTWEDGRTFVGTIDEGVMPCFD